jgi:hypothetical protein
MIKLNQKFKQEEDTIKYKSLAGDNTCAQVTPGENRIYLARISGQQVTKEATRRLAIKSTRTKSINMDLDQSYAIGSIN